MISLLALPAGEEEKFIEEKAAEGKPVKNCQCSYKPLFRFKDGFYEHCLFSAVSFHLKISSSKTTSTSNARFTGGSRAAPVQKGGVNVVA